MNVLVSELAATKQTSDVVGSNSNESRYSFGILKMDDTRFEIMNEENGDGKKTIKKQKRLIHLVCF